MANQNSRAARRNAKKDQQSGGVKQQDTTCQSQQSQKPEHSLPLSGALLRDAPASTSKPETHHCADKTDKHPHVMRVLQAFWIFCRTRARATFTSLDKHNGIVTSVATVAIGIFTWVYVGVSKKQWETAQSALELSERAYVTVGRQDGTVANFIMHPDDIKAPAGILLYFRNSGHLPARFNWGVMTIIDGNSQVESPHKFKRMTYSENLGANIAGDSIYVADVVEMRQARVHELESSSTIFSIYGNYEYCDGFARYHCRQFMIFYQGVPYGRFVMGHEYGCGIPAFSSIPHLSNIRYSSACEVPEIPEVIPGQN